MLALGARQTVLAQETDDPVKIEIYKRFVDNRAERPAVAYQAAQDYLKKYNKDKDQYTDYLNKWVMFYERDERKRMLPGLIKNGHVYLALPPLYRIDAGKETYWALTDAEKTKVLEEELAIQRDAMQKLKAMGADPYFAREQDLTSRRKTA